MIEHPRLRQLGLGELLGESWRVYRAHFPTYLLIVGLTFVPYALLNLVLRLVPVMNPLGSQDEHTLRQATLGLVYLFVLQPLQTGALAQAVTDHYRREPVSVGPAYLAALARVAPLVGSRVLATLLSSTLLVAGVGAVFGAFIAVLVSSKGTQVNMAAVGAFGLIGLVLIPIGLVVWLVAAFLLLFTTQVAQLERHGVWGSMRRAGRLSRSAVGRTLGYLLVSGLLIALVFVLPSWFLWGFDLYRYPALMVTTSLANYALQLVATPYLLIAWTLMYYDLRVRGEGFELESDPALAYGHGLGDTIEELKMDP